MMYREAVEKLERDYPELASTQVPAGITRYWLSALPVDRGWKRVTGILPVQRLSREIRLADDLHIIGELLSANDLEDLLALMLELPRFPREAAVIAAPDLEAALIYLERSLSIENPHYSLHFERKPDGGAIRLTFHEALGVFAPFLEIGLHVYLYRFIAAFVEPALDRRAALSRLRVSLGHAEDRHAAAVSNLLGCEVEQGRGQSVMLVPDEIFAASNLEHDPDVWAQMERALEKARRRQPVFQDDLTRQTLLDRIGQILEDEGSVPQLPRIAAEFGFSERTFSRRLTEQGLAMKQLVASARMKSAARHLRMRGSSVGSVGRKLGYADTSSFVRAFRKWYGVSPGQWQG
ncbi:helix-turn-helix transcriptional regulator [Erythrobacter sp. GH1-10]|uniref:helix-turn-helix transcriptional regulator n=1 Tax=Erythrobacter sp. GH1-10 TaxID=3349334 RepID=UPI003877C0C2